MHDSIRPLLVALLVPAVLAAQTESGAFIVRLGNDTLAIEQFTRTRERLQGEQVLRTPRTVHRLYTATFGADGAVQQFELVTHNVADGPGPPETRATVEFQGDSAIVVVPRGDSSVTMRMAAAKGATPWVAQTYALIEHMARRARAAGAESFGTQAVFPGNREPLAVTINRLGPDSLTIQLGQIGPLRMRVDEAGKLLGLTGVGSTMQVTVERVASVDLKTLGPAFASRSLGQLSPRDSFQVNVGGATLGVNYSRPSKRGRVIFGNVVPWDKVWRTGANAATIFETSADIVIAGIMIPAGKYSLWTIPSPAGWKLIVNKNTGQWGTEYDAAHDLVRLDMTVEQLAQPLEQFTISIEPQGPGGVLALAWETTRASIAVAKK